MQEERKKLLQAFLEEPTIYEIEVLEDSMLPDNLKNEKDIIFTVKPPTLEILAKVSHLLQDLPDALTKGEASFKNALPHLDTMVKVICTIAHAKPSAYPDWHERFILANCTAKEVFGIFQETAVKMQTDFFLQSFHIAGLTNPMMMRKRKSSTLISL